MLFIKAFHVLNSDVNLVLVLKDALRTICEVLVLVLESQVLVLIL